MDASLFTEKMTGRLVPISTPAPDHAFVPDPLSASWVFPQRLWPRLLEAKEELARLDGAGRHLQNPELLLQPLKRREALKSSSLEGTFASPQELLLFEAADDRHRTRGDVAEVFNYGQALDLGSRLLTTLPFSLRFIRDIHERLLDGVRGQQSNPGHFRRAQVHIGVERRFVPAPPTEMGSCLDAFERAMHAEVDVDPLVWALLLHYQFEAIHPFLDGNGRVGRVLLCLMIAERCGLARPWLYLSPWFDRHRNDYIDHLFDVSAAGDWESWLEFCLIGVREQSKDAMSRLERLIDLRKAFRERVAQSGGSVRLYRTVEHLFDVLPIVQVTELRDRLGVSYPTAKADVERLVELDVLSELRGLYPKTFVASEIVRLGFGD